MLQERDGYHTLNIPPFLGIRKTASPALLPHAFEIVVPILEIVPKGCLVMERKHRRVHLFVPVHVPV